MSSTLLQVTYHPKKFVKYTREIFQYPFLRNISGIEYYKVQTEKSEKTTVFEAEVTEVTQDSEEENSGFSVFPYKIG